MGDITERAVAVDIGDGLKLESDGTVKRGETLAREADVAPRTDLPPKHPLYLSRAVRCVPSGMPDCVIVDGRLVPIETKEPKPGEEKPIEEVTRVR